jgi:hypothetical protein
MGILPGRAQVRLTYLLWQIKVAEVLAMSRRGLR